MRHPAQKPSLKKSSLSPCCAKAFAQTFIPEKGKAWANSLQGKDLLKFRRLAVGLGVEHSRSAWRRRSGGVQSLGARPHRRRLELGERFRRPRLHRRSQGRRLAVDLGRRFPGSARPPRARPRGGRFRLGERDLNRAPRRCHQNRRLGVDLGPVPA